MVLIDSIYVWTKLIRKYVNDPIFKKKRSNNEKVNEIKRDHVYRDNFLFNLYSEQKCASTR